MDYSTVCQVEFSTLAEKRFSVDKSTMSQPSATLIERIDLLLSRIGKSRYWLSNEISDGRQPGIVTDIARRGTVPRGDRLTRIAEALGTTSEYLMGQATTPDQPRSEVSVHDRQIEWRGPPRDEPGIPLVGTGDCADLELDATDGQTVSVERSSFDSDYHVRMIARPPALRGARDLYAVYFHGESMQPRFEPGEIGIVDPRRPAGPGDYVLVQLNSGDSDDVVTVLVKRLVRQNAAEIVLEQFNPALTFTVPKSRVARVHRILQQTDLLL